jgi:hypothetical protein
MNQLERDMNALRGHFVRKPQAQTMADLLLAAGEDIQPAVRRMVEDGELVVFTVEGARYYQVTEKLRPYKPA